MHYYVAAPDHRPTFEYQKLLGLACLVIFGVLVAMVWLPYSRALVNATAIRVLPPAWADKYAAATLPKTVLAATDNQIIINTATLRISAPIVEGIDPIKDLLRGVGHDIVSAKPGAQGRVILSGHRFWPDKSPWATVFFSLDRLKVGDAVTVIYDNQTYHYHITNSWDVPPGQAQPQLAPSAEPVLTIYTCGPNAYESRHRLGFDAVLDQSQLQHDTNKVINTLQDGVL